jgi:membrane protease YdiL (CAAX protease family)
VQQINRRPHFVGPVAMASANKDSTTESTDDSVPADRALDPASPLKAFDESESDQLFVSGTAFEFVLVGVAAILGKLLSVSALGAGFELSPSTLAAGVLWTIPPLAFVGSIRLLKLEALEEIEKITEEFARRLFVKRPDWQLALFCFAAGVGEEMLFRGIFHQKLELLFGFAPAAVTVGVGFGLAHNLSPAYFIISGLSSCIFSVMFANSGNNIVIPVVAHALYDLIALKLTLDDIAKKDAQAAAAK